LGFAIVAGSAFADASTQMFMAGPSAPSFLGFRLLDLDGSLVQWGRPGRGGAATVTVSYAFVRELTQLDDARNCQAMQPLDGLLAASGIDFERLRSETRAAFSMWEGVADIRFREVADPSHAGILIGAQAEPLGRAFADVKYAAGEGPWRQIERSLICLNPAKRWKIGFDGNLKVYDLRYTLAHEIGHAIGLDHPEPAGQIMSARYEERFRTLQFGDVRGAVQLYGLRRNNN
jgi:hypothetical protein